MTAVPTSGLPGSLRRNVAPTPPPRQGIEQRLLAPGLAAPPPDLSGVRQIQQIERALGLAGNAAGQVGVIARRQRLELEQEAREIESQYRGDASLDARTQLPVLRQRVAAGEFDHLLNADVPLDQVVEQFLTEQLTDPETGEPFATTPYVDQYRQVIQPSLTAALVQRQTARQDSARAEVVALDAEAVTSATSADVIRKAVENTRRVHPDLTETQALNLVLVPGLRVAAEQGDVGRFNLIAGELGDRFPGMVALLRLEAQNNKRQAQTRARAQRAEAVENLVADELDRSAPNFDAARDAVAGAQVDPVLKLNLNQRIDATADRFFRDAERRQEEWLQAEFDGLAAEGLPPDELAAQLHERADTVALGIDAEKLAPLIQRYSLHAIQRAAQAGDVVTVDRLTPMVDQRPESQAFVIQQRGEALNRHRDRVTQQLQADAIARPGAAAAVFNQAAQRLDVFRNQPASPGGITPQQYAAVANAAARESVKVTRRELEVATLRGVYGQAARQLIDPNVPTPPRAQVSGDAVLEVWADAGIAEVNAADGQTVLRRIAEPERAAVLTHLAGGVPAAGWYEQIGAGFDLHTDAQQVTGSAYAESARALLALHRQNPALAQEVIARHIDTDAGRTRAQRFIEVSAQRIGPLTVDPGDTGTTAGVIAGRQLRPDVLGEINAAAKAVAAVSPVNLDRTAALTLATGDTSAAVVAEETLTRHLPPGFEPTLGILFGRRLDFGADTDIAPIQSDVAQAFEHHLIDAFRERKAMGETDDAAAKNARTVAAARTMALFPPVEWNQEIMFLRGGALVPGFGGYAEQRLQALDATGRLNQSPAFILDNYLPRWSDNLGAWTLVSRGNADVPLRDVDGDLVVIRAGTAVRDALQQHIDDIANQIGDVEAQRIAREQWRHTVNQSMGSMMFQP